MQIHLYVSNFGPTATLAIPNDPTPAGPSVQASADLGMERVAQALPHAPEAMRGFGLGVNLSASA